MKTTTTRILLGILFILTFLATASAPAEDRRVDPQRALQWKPQEYLEATLHAGIAFLEPERQWERMDVWVPKSPIEGKLPCVVAVFGGGYGDKMGGFINDARPLLKRGFVVAAPDYALQTDAPVPLCSWDVANAIRYLRAHADRFRIDPERIGIWGWSAGGWIAQDLCYAGPETDTATAPEMLPHGGSKDPTWVKLRQQYENGELLHCYTDNVAQLQWDERGRRLSGMIDVWIMPVDDANHWGLSPPRNFENWPTPSTNSGLGCSNSRSTIADAPRELPGYESILRCLQPRFPVDKRLHVTGQTLRRGLPISSGLC